MRVGMVASVYSRSWPMLCVLGLPFDWLAVLMLASAAEPLILPRFVMLIWKFVSIASVVIAGEEGWSVETTMRALERVAIREGRAVAT